MDNYFSQEFKGKTTKELKKIQDKAKKILDFHFNDEEKISEYSSEDVIDLVYLFEKSALLLRSNYEEAERNSGNFFDEDYEKICLKNMPCSISFDGEIFRLKTPYTIKRAYSKSMEYQKENCLFLNYVNAEIKKWTEEHPDIKLAFNPNFREGQLHFVIIRYGTRCNHSLHCDHDNLENSKIQNAICLALAVSDNPLRMSFHSIFRLCKSEKEVGTEFIITTDKHIMEFILQAQN